MTVNLVLLEGLLLRYLGSTANKCVSVAALNLEKKEKVKPSFFKLSIQSSVDPLQFFATCL